MTSATAHAPFGDIGRIRTRQAQLDLGLRVLEGHFDPIVAVNAENHVALARLAERFGLSLPATQRLAPP